MSYAKKAIMKIEKREPRESKGSEISRSKPTPKHDGNKPTHHAHLVGGIHPKHDHVSMAVKKIGC
jgi:hypothetical protein